MYPGTTLSQLSDSGQTLSEDSGVDIAEARGLSKDSNPWPTKNQASQATQGPHGAQGSAVLASKQVRPTKGPYHNRNNMDESQMESYSLYTVVHYFLTRAYRALVKSSALYRE